MALGKLQLSLLLLLGLGLQSGWASLCPYGGWQSYGNSCYYFYNANYTRSWNDARQICMAQDGDLVTIESTRERDWILNQCRARTARSHNRYTNWWTGLNAKPDGSSWSWPNSTNVNINLLNGKWMSGQPHKDSTHQCVEIRSLQFNVARCTDAYQAICERPVGRPLTCDPGWTLFSGQCYRYFGSAQSFQGAKNVCHRYGSLLPQIYDSNTQTIVWDLARTKGQNLWINLHSAQQGNSYVWKWNNGSALTHPTFWNRNPPHSLGGNVNKMCVEQLQNQGATRSWNYVTCTSRRSFVCQKPEGSCPNGWLQLTNKCYFIYTRSGKSFNDAQSYCSGRGANLAALTSMVSQHMGKPFALHHINRALQRRVIHDRCLKAHARSLYAARADVTHFLWPYVHNARSAGATLLWIGLTDYNQDNGPWKWVSGNQTLGHWTNWITNHVTNTRGRQDCIYIDSNDHNLKWRDTTSCGSPRRFICQLPVNKALRRPTPPPVHYTCPRGFQLYTPLKTCIQLKAQDKTWDQARADCQSHNSDLVTIPNVAFNNYIKAQIRAHRGKYWIGLHDRHQENKFEWLDSDSRATYTNWQPGQPQHAGSTANCVAIYDQGNYLWWEVSCGTKYHYICQTPAIQNGHVLPTTTQKPISPNCGPMWDDDPNSYSCYMFNTERLSWQDARLACQAQHGDLVSINSVTEQFYINGRISGLSSNFFWVGANDQRTESGWRWSDQSPVSFVNWKPGEPNNQGNSDCVGISGSDGRWSDFTCTSRYAYICEKMGKATPKPTPPLTSPAHLPNGMTWGCPVNWRGFQGQCYLFGRQDRISWQTARTKCGSMGSSLVSIHNEAENKFVFSTYPRGYHGQAWIGLNDVMQEGSFGWTDMSPVSYTKWNNREPNNLHNEDCVAMYHNSAWTDYSCTTRGVGGYICKKPMSSQSRASSAMSKGCSAGLGFRAQCYIYVSTTRTWNDAQNDCRHRHGNLATVNDRELQAFVSAELVNRAGRAYWIGLKNPTAQNNTYTWVTGYDLDFTAWSASHTGNEKGTCIGMATGRPVGLWTNFPCNQRLPYICEVPRQGFTTPTPTPPTTTPKIRCPAHWATYQTVCIKAFNASQSDRLSWMESRRFCQSFGGDLVSIWRRSMETFIIRRVLHNATDGVWWIGLNDRDSESGHVWSDEHGVDYTNWSPGEPNDYNNKEDCVSWVFPQNGWNDDNCYTAKNFICSIPRGIQLITTPVAPTATQNSLCQNSSWLYWDNQCYFLSPEDGPLSSLSWYEARRTCQSMNADLVAVHGVDENGFLTSTMSRHSAWTFWIGLNDLDQSGYMWSNRDPVNFVSWSINEPNDAFGGESCVESTSSGDWNDRNCQDQNGYICERPLNGVVTQQPTLPPVLGGCPPGFTSVNLLDKCYKLAGLTDDTRKNFTDAITACSQMYPPATLVSIHNWIEQTYVTTLLAQLPHYVWIGLNDREQRNYFAWHDNSEVDFTHWGGGQPDENLNSNNPDDRRDCVAINPDPRYAGNWNDMMCRNRNHYICEVPRAPGGATPPPLSNGCPKGYTRHLNNCYQYFNTPSTWSLAQSTCQVSGGHLATPTDRFHQGIIRLLRRTDRLHLRNISDIWIGMTLPQGSLKFQWVNNWPVRMTRWANGEPDISGSCVHSDFKDMWHDDSCDKQYPFVCQIDKGGPPPTVSTVHGLCPSGKWTAAGEYCYQLVTDTPRSWPEARYACSVMGAALVSVHSSDEMATVSQLFSQALSKGVDSSVDVWLGLTKGMSDGFSWSDGTELEYDNWDDGEPSDTDNGLHQDCVQAALASGKWNDVDCFDPNYYVCKMLQETKTSPRYSTLPAGQGNQPTPSNPSGSHGGNQPTPYNPAGNHGGNQPTPYNPAGNHGGNQPTPYNPAGNHGGNQPTPYNPAGNHGGNQPTPYNPAGNHGGNQPTRYNPGGHPTQQAITGNNNSGLSGGGIAGVVVGTVAIIAVAVVVIVLFRDRLPLRTPRGPPLTTGSSGFDNALYSKSGDAETGKGSVVFGNENNTSDS